MRRKDPRAFRVRTGQALLLAGILVSALAAVGIGGADTSGSPDTNTRADWAPATVDANNGQTAPATFTGGVEGRALKIHVDATAGKFFGVNAARMCKSGLNIVTSSQMSPTQFGNCIPKPFVGTSDDDPARQDDSYLNEPADQSHTFVDFTFRVGSGTQTFNDTNGNPHTITCDANNPCSVWLWESVDPTIKSGGSIFKHYDIQYSSTGVTTTTSPPTGSTSTTTAGVTTTTQPGATTTTQPGATTTTQPGATTTTTHPSSTTSTTGSGSTTTTSGTGSTSSTSSTSTTRPGSTTTAPPGATTTTQPGATTTTQLGATTTVPIGSVTSTTEANGVSVSPASAPPGGTINLNTTGWKPCNGSTSTTSTSTTVCPPVTVTIQSDPVVLGTMTPDASGSASGQFTIPTSIAPGAHTITVTGTGPDGTSRTLSVPFTVTTASGSAPGSASGASGAAPASSAAGTSSGLANTGLRLGLLWAGLAMVAVGALLTRSSRRPSPTTS